MFLLFLACDVAHQAAPPRPERPPEAQPAAEPDDEPARPYRDADGDGWGDPDDRGPVGAPGHVDRSGDCDDGDARRNPGAAEVGCDFLDNDCSGETTDDLGGYCHFSDGDGDHWGDAGRGFSSPNAAEAGASREHGDCDDADPTVFPEAEDHCFDGRDGDCDGLDCGSDVQAPYGATAVVEGPIGFGSWLHDLGDVDSDGANDVWVAQWGHFPVVDRTEGADTFSEEPWGAYVLSGGTSGGPVGDVAAAFFESTQQVYAQGARDADGDGGRDLWWWDPGPGSAARRLGSATLLAGSKADSATIALGSQGTWAVVPLAEDVAVMDRHTVYVFVDDGGPGARGAADARVAIAMGDPYYILSIGPGDLDGDGREDLLLMLDQELFLASALPDGGLTLADLEPIGRDASCVAGAAVAGVGDIDGDGLPDFSNSGCIYAGGPGAWGSPHAVSGWLLSEAGDLNGDGHADALHREGVVFGPISGSLDVAESVAIAPAEDGADLDRRVAAGMSLLGIGDVDGDGLDDLAVSSPAMGRGLWTDDHIGLGTAYEGPGRLWIVPGYAIR